MAMGVVHTVGQGHLKEKVLWLQKIEGGRWTPLVPPALNLTFEGQKGCLVDSISLSFKTLLSLVEKLFWSICSVTTFGVGKIAKICSNVVQ